jgi:glucosamine-phosphate N-acetyltransferase
MVSDFDFKIQYSSLEKLVLDNFEKIELIKNKYLNLLNELSESQNISNDLFLENIKKISTTGIIMVGYIGTIGMEDFDIVGSGTVYLEPKIIRSGKSVGHIEDIVVKSNFRGKKISQVILNELKEFAFKSNCYKVILDCEESVCPVYKSNGFEIKGIQMAKYF